MKHNRILSFLVLLLILLSLPACARKKPQPTEVKATEAVEAQPEEKVHLVVGYQPHMSFSPFYVAVEKGYFAEQGLEVELQPFRTGSEMIAPLSLGQLEAGAGETGTAFFNAVHQELDIRAGATLVTMTKDHGSIILAVRKELFDSGEVKDLSDLKGRKVAVNNNRGMSEYWVAMLAEQGGLTIDDVEMVIMPFPEMLEAMKNGAVDAALLTYPLAGQAIQEGENGEPPIAVTLVTGDKFTKEYPQNAVIYLGQDLLAEENHDVAVRFLVAVLKANRDLQGDALKTDGQVVKAISKWTKVAEPVVSSSVSGYFDPNGKINLASTEDVQEYLVGRGYTEYQEPLPVESFLDTVHLQEALDLLGEYKP